MTIFLSTENVIFCHFGCLNFEKTVPHRCIVKTFELFSLSGGEKKNTIFRHKKTQKNDEIFYFWLSKKWGSKNEPKSEISFFRAFFKKCLFFVSRRPFLPNQEISEKNREFCTRPAGGPKTSGQKKKNWGSFFYVFCHFLDPFFLKVLWKLHSKHM